MQKGRQTLAFLFDRKVVPATYTWDATYYAASLTDFYSLGLTLRVFNISFIIMGVPDCLFEELIVTHVLIDSDVAKLVVKIWRSLKYKPSDEKKIILVARVNV